MKNRLVLASFAFILISVLFFLGVPVVQADILSQQPTVAIPTVTGTPLGPMAAVNGDQNMINVHNGPGQSYPVIGILVLGQKVPAIGADPEGQWIQIIYQGVAGNVGWVSASLVTLTKSVPVVTPPPPPASRPTPTLDPTLAAQYSEMSSPTQLPTYTPGAPLVVPTFAPSTRTIDVTRLPMGFIIIGLAVVGLFGTLLSILRGR